MILSLDSLPIRPEALADPKLSSSALPASSVTPEGAANFAAAAEKNTAKNAAQNTDTLVYCLQNGKRMSYLCCSPQAQIILLIDPPEVAEEAVELIENTNAQYFFAVLTECRRGKKELLRMWNALYDFTVIAPESPSLSGLDEMFSLSRSRRQFIPEADTLYGLRDFRAKNNRDAGADLAYFMAWKEDEISALMLYLRPYLFSGRLLQTSNPHRLPLSENASAFIEALPEDTIMLPELGGIRAGVPLP